jgi:hypothetical protein
MHIQLSGRKHILFTQITGLFSTRAYHQHRHLGLDNGSPRLQRNDKWNCRSWISVMAMMTLILLRSSIAPALTKAEE